MAPGSCADGGADDAQAFPEGERLPEVDPIKDEALVHAFADAIKQAAMKMESGA